MTLNRGSGSRRSALAGIIGFTAVSLPGLSACQPVDSVVQQFYDCDDIYGVVSGPDGPEAGVSIIARTTDLTAGPDPSESTLSVSELAEVEFVRVPGPEAGGSVARL